MSDDSPTAVSRKEKRAKRDAERAEKFKSGAKKSKAPASTPEDDEEVVAEEDNEARQEELSNTRTSDMTQSASKKRKRVEAATDEEQSQPSTVEQSSKKRQRTTKEAGTEESGKKRFIIFCGNLPYATTDQSLDRHFEKLKPFTLRHRTDPKTKRSKGFAFIEFENYDRMKTCLKLYHHSFFDPDNPDAKDPQADPTISSRVAKKSKGRRINVELTAGGGGKTEARKEKITAKNERLEGQRQRRMEAERKEKERKRKEHGEDPDERGPNGAHSRHQKVADGTTDDSAMGGMHPSRLARIQ